MVHRLLRVAIVAALGSLLSCTTGAESSPSPSARKSVSASTTESPSIAADLASAPTDCPTSRPLLQHPPGQRELFGGAPAYGAFYANPDSSSGTFHIGGNTRMKRQGWPVKVLWVLEPGTTEPVTISGQETDTGAPIMFDPVNGPFSDTLQLDPRYPGTPTRLRGWKAYPSLVWFPEAPGCYLIEASWVDGSWQRGFGLGG
jgi:hypothetical protein